jgi:hypothetical protein
VGDGEHATADRRAESAGDHVEAGQAGVGRHELVGFVDELGDEGLAHDAVGLAADQQREGEEVQGQVEQGEGQRGRTGHADGEQDRGEPAVPQPEAVDHRPDERCQQGERCHVDEEVKQDLLS